MKFTIVPSGATRGDIRILAESIDVTSKDFSTVVTLPYALATVSASVCGPTASKVRVPRAPSLAIFSNSTFSQSIRHVYVSHFRPIVSGS